MGLWGLPFAAAFCAFHSGLTHLATSTPASTRSHRPTRHSMHLTFRQPRTEHTALLQRTDPKGGGEFAEQREETLFLTTLPSPQDTGLRSGEHKTKPFKHKAWEPGRGIKHTASSSASSSGWGPLPLSVPLTLWSCGDGFAENSMWGHSKGDTGYPLVYKGS